MEIEMFFARYDKDGRFKYNPEDDNDQLKDEDDDKEEDFQEQPRPLSGKQAREQR